MCFIFHFQRKKIGLSRKTKRSLNIVNNSQNRKNTVLEFIKKNVKRKECKLFTANPFGKSKSPKGDGPVCFCGEVESVHKTRIQHKHAGLKQPVQATIEEEDDEQSVTSSNHILESIANSSPSPQLRYANNSSNFSDQ